MCFATTWVETGVRGATLWVRARSDVIHEEVDLRLGARHKHVWVEIRDSLFGEQVLTEERVAGALPARRASVMGGGQAYTPLGSLTQAAVKSRSSYREWVVGGGEGWGEYSVVCLGEHEGGSEAVFGGEVAVAVGDALDQAVDAESP